MQDKNLVRRCRKLLGTLLLISALAVTQFPISAAGTGTSTASDFQMSGTTLIGYTGTATTVSVPDFIKTIQNGAFANDTDLYTVHLPDKLETIGDDAFAGCSMLTVVDFPDSLTTIGDFAFSGCDALTDVDLGKHVNKIGNGAFAACGGLSEIGFDKDNQSFASYGGALYNGDKTKLYQVYGGSEYTKYTMPDSVQEMLPYAFWGCDKLRFAYLNPNIRRIPSNAFANCTGLEEITLPYSVTGIDARAFWGCTNLASAEIPPTVKDIAATAFEGCTKLVIKAQEGSVAKAFDDAREKGDVAAAEYEDTAGQAAANTQHPVAGAADAAQTAQNMATDGVSKQDAQAADAAFPQSGAAEHGNLASSDVLGQSSIVGGRAFVFIDNTEEETHGSLQQTPGQTEQTADRTRQAGQSGTVQFPDGNTGQTFAGQENTAVPQGTGDLIPADGTERDVASADGVSDSTDGKKRGFPKYTVAGDKIAAQAYYQDKTLTAYQIPEEIKQIGDFAFARSGLSSITVPEGVTQIGYGAFYHCDDLSQVTLPSTLVRIEPSAFEHTKWLDSWLNGGTTNEYLIVGDGILLAYKGKESQLTLPEGIKQIAPQVFRDHKGITGVSLPNSLQIIGEEAFAGCSNLRTVSGGVAVEEIKDRAFYGCPIETIRIPESVQKIGLQAYGTDASEGQRDSAVVFMGNSLPDVSYEKTSTRLSHSAYRDLAFAGVPVAIVSGSVSDYSDTVLDAGRYGFRGLVCSVQQEAAGGEAGVLRVLASTLESGSPLPDSVTVYGSTYLFAGDKEKARNTDASAAGETLDPSGGGSVKVLVNSAVLPEEGRISAMLLDSGESGNLVIRDSSEARQEILDAYQVLYGEEQEPALYGFDMTLYDQTMSVPITRLGNSSVKIQMPVPEGLGGSGLHVVCTDEDGQLEDIAYQPYMLDGKSYVEFYAKHFSSYGMYQYEGNAQIRTDDNGGVLTAKTRQKDNSPDTGDLLHPKWFLALGLAALAMVAFFGGKREPEQ